MSPFAELLSGMHGEVVRAVAESTASALVAGLWQSALLVVGVGLVLNVVPRTTAAVRFAIWTVVFGLSAGMPFVEMLVGRQGSAATGQLRVDSTWSYLLAAVWIVASIVRMAQLAGQGWKLRELWRRAVPVADAALDTCSGLQKGRSVQVCVSADVDRPSVIGFFAPKILVPTWLFEQLSTTELRHIVLHEMEHLRRRDDWMNLLQKVGLVVFPLNPALRWVDRQMAAERELACDDGVLRQTQMRRAYASCLTSIAAMRLERKMHRRMVALALGLLGTAGMLRGRSQFSRRIEGILGRRAVMNPMLARVVAVVLVIGVFGAGVELMRSPLLVSFGPRAISGDVAVDGGGHYGGARAMDAGFHVGQAKAMGDLVARGAGNTREVNLVVQAQGVPQRRTLRSKRVAHGMAKPLPINTMGFSANTMGFSAQRTGLSDHRAALPTQRAGFEAVREVASKDAGAIRRRIKTESSAEEQWMVLTSTEEDAPARVVVRMGDGRFYVAPYAAVPVRDGWLIVQL